MQYLTPQNWIIFLTIFVALMLFLNVYLQHMIGKYRHDNSILRGRLKHTNIVAQDALDYIDSPLMPPVTKQIKAYSGVRHVRDLSARGVIQ